MVYILPERLLALVRPAFDLVLRRIRTGVRLQNRDPLDMRRNLAPGCISSDVKLCQRKPLFPFFRDPFFWNRLFLFFLFFLSPAKVGSLEMQPGAAF